MSGRHYLFLLNNFAAYMSKNNVDYVGVGSQQNVISKVISVRFRRGRKFVVLVVGGRAAS